MIKLIRHFDSNFTIACHGEPTILCATRLEAVEALYAMDISFEEIHFCLDDMETKGNTYAEFGVNKTFTFSARRHLMTA